MLLRLALVVAFLAFLASPALADEEERSLSIGDPAPAIDIAYWIKGVELDRRGNFEPVTEFEAGKVYVLEFWATWCGPCRVGMPHLSEIQEHFAEKGVRVIGISDESLPKVVEFLWKKDRDGLVQNDRTHYTLTADPDRSVHKDYMEAANQSGIPTAFIVGKSGIVEWIGHPMNMEDALEAVVNDTWDRDTFKAQWEEARRMSMAMRKARARMARATQAEDWAGLIGIFDELLELAPDNLSLMMQKLQVMLTKQDDAQAAYVYGEKVAQGARDNAALLNQLAWTIVDDQAVKTRNLDFALKVAERANELSESKDGAVMDTLARVHYERGSLDEAVVWQARAVAAAPAGQLKTQLIEVLGKYVAEMGEQLFGGSAPVKPHTKQQEAQKAIPLEPARQR